MAKYTELGIEASEAAWRALGVSVHTTGEVTAAFTAWSKEDLDALLLRGCAETGARDERAVVWAIAERARSREASERSAAERALAQSVTRLADAIGAESAASLVARMPDRLRPYAESVLRRA